MTDSPATRSQSKTLLDQFASAAGRFVLADRLAREASSRLLRYTFRRQGIDGYNFFGFLTANLGLGMAARNSLGVLESRGASISMTDVDPGSGRSGQVPTSCFPGERSADRGRYSVNLFHLNPPDAFNYLWRHPEIAERDRLNVCVPFWELDTLPDDWVEILAGMDVVLAPTRFIERAVRDAIPDGICLLFPQALHLPEAVVGNRTRWALPSDAIVFVASFDLASDVARKNPLGALSAFQLAFPERQDVRLVLKSHPNSIEHLAPHHSLISDVVARDARVIFVEESLPFADLLSLYGCADAYISLHRSEGLGLGMMEVMALGIPVIATAYSGPMDFLTPSNSMLVDFDKVPVKSDHAAYSIMNDRTSWAEPRLESAAVALRSIAEDSSLRQKLGERARADIKATKPTPFAAQPLTILLLRFPCMTRCGVTTHGSSPHCETPPPIGRGLAPWEN